MKVEIFRDRKLCLNFKFDPVNTLSCSYVYHNAWQQAVFFIFVFVSVVHCTVDSDSSEEEIVILTANEVSGGHENRYDRKDSQMKKSESSTITGHLKSVMSVILKRLGECEDTHT